MGYLPKVGWWERRSFRREGGRQSCNLVFQSFIGYLRDIFQDASVKTVGNLGAFERRCAG